MMKYRIFTLFLLISLSFRANSQQVIIKGTKFYVNDQEIFFNGINSAWQYQDSWDRPLDFLGRNFNEAWWLEEFQRYTDNKINLARIWIHGAGNFSPALNGDGMVTGASSQFWSDMDALVRISRDRRVYIMPTFWSFDMVIPTNYGGTWSAYADQYRQIINDTVKTKAYIDNFLIPFLKRYENEPYVMGYDICNEIEHIWRDENCGKLNKDNVVRFVAMCADAINRNSAKPVTMGSMWIIFNSSRYNSWTGEPHVGNNWSNASLQAQFNSPQAFLDFYSPHWYQWQSTDGPFNKSIGYWMDEADRPVLIGETPGYDIAPGTHMNYPNWDITLANFYKQSYWNGYSGVCGWKNPKGDGYGDFESIATAAKDYHFYYPNLVYPIPAPTINLPGRLEAENWATMSGIQTEVTTDAGGGYNVGWIDSGDWLDYNVNVQTAGTYMVQYRVASPGTTGQIQLESANTILAATNVPATGGWQNWTTLTTAVYLPAGKQTLRLHATNGGFNINWADFQHIPDRINLAYRRPVTTSSNKSASLAGAKAVDANGFTHWESIHANNQYIIVDLGASYHVSRVKLAWEAAYARDYQIQFSADNSTWTTVSERWGKTSAAVEDHTNLTGTARYVKIYCINRVFTKRGFSLFELEVYGSRATGTITLEAANEAEAAPQELTFYPNPVSDNLYLSLADDKITDVQIYNTLGATVKQFKVNKNIIDVSDLKPGVYLLSVTTTKGQLKARRFIKN